MKEWFIYILRLEKNSWYVGTAEDLIRRLKSRAMKSPYSRIDKRAGGSTAKKGLTGIRKAVALHAVFSVKCSEKTLTEIEDAITASMGNKYGYDVVRGGTWHQLWGVKVKGAACQAVTHAKKHTQNNLRAFYNIMEFDLNVIKHKIPFDLTRRNTL